MPQGLKCNTKSGETFATTQGTTLTYGMPQLRLLPLFVAHVVTGAPNSSKWEARNGYTGRAFEICSPLPSYT